MKEQRSILHRSQTMLVTSKNSKAKEGPIRNKSDDEEEGEKEEKGSIHEESKKKERASDDEEEEEEDEDQEEFEKFEKKDNMEPASLAPSWMLEAERLLANFERKYESVKKTQSELDQGFKLFDEKKRQYKLQARTTSPQKAKKKVETRGIERLNYHLILIIASFAEMSPALQLVKLSSLSKTLKTKLDNRAVWREIVGMYFGSEFYKLNERRSEAFELQNSKRSFWKETFLQFQRKLGLFTKTFKIYRTSICSRRISTPSLQKDVITSLAFFNQSVALKVVSFSSGDKQFIQVFEDFLIKEKFFFTLSHLINCDFLPIRYDAISIVVTLFSEPLYKIFEKDIESNIKLSVIKTSELNSIQALKLSLNTNNFGNQRTKSFAFDPICSMVPLV